LPGPLSAKSERESLQAQFLPRLVKSFTLKTKIVCLGVILLPRRPCCGIIDHVPCCRRFSPEGQEVESTVTVTLEEIESIRLKDLVGIDQNEGALSMGISRPTFQRILQRARKKVAKALVEGHSIVFEGGSHRTRERAFECDDCGKLWEEAPCTQGGKHGCEICCPECGSLKKLKICSDGEKKKCGGGNHLQGHGCCCGGNDSVGI